MAPIRAEGQGHQMLVPRRGIAVFDPLCVVLVNCTQTGPDRLGIVSQQMLRDRAQGDSGSSWLHVPRLSETKG